MSTTFTPRIVLRIGIALFGVWYLLVGLEYLFDAAAFAVRFNELPEGSSTRGYAVRGAFSVILGLFLMCGFLPFEGLIFPQREAETEKVGEAPAGDQEPPA